MGLSAMKNSIKHLLIALTLVLPLHAFSEGDKGNGPVENPIPDGYTENYCRATLLDNPIIFNQEHRQEVLICCEYYPELKGCYDMIDTDETFPEA